MHALSLVGCLCVFLRMTPLAVRVAVAGADVESAVGSPSSLSSSRSLLSLSSPRCHSGVGDGGGTVTVTIVGWFVAMGSLIPSVGS